MVTYEDVLWVAGTIYMYLPAYIANAIPVIFGGGKPLDGGYILSDGQPLFGNHKTIRGTFCGLIAGFIIGLLQGHIVRGMLLSTGTIGGDILISFFKRRIKLQPGALFPVVDQIGFIIFALILSTLVEPLKWDRAITIVLATIPIHFLTNVVAWKLKLKENPW